MAEYELGLCWIRAMMKGSTMSFTNYFWNCDATNPNAVNFSEQIYGCLVSPKFSPNLCIFMMHLWLKTNCMDLCRLFLRLGCGVLCFCFWLFWTQRRDTRQQPIDAPRCFQHVCPPLRDQWSTSSPCTCPVSGPHSGHQNNWPAGPHWAVFRRWTTFYFYFYFFVAFFSLINL